MKQEHIKLSPEKKTKVFELISILTNVDGISSASIRTSWGVIADCTGQRVNFELAQLCIFLLQTLAKPVLYDDFEFTKNKIYSKKLDKDCKLAEQPEIAYEFRSFLFKREKDGKVSFDIEDKNYYPFLLKMKEQNLFCIPEYMPILISTCSDKEIRNDYFFREARSTADTLKKKIWLETLAYAINLYDVHDEKIKRRDEICLNEARDLLLKIGCKRKLRRAVKRQTIIY